MKVIILCGGMGMRLREETEYRPKPLAEVGGRPILWHIMKLYGHYGHHDFLMCLGYKGNLIKRYFLDYEAMNNDFTIHLGKKNHTKFHGGHQEQDYEVTLVDTGLEAMTGSRLKQVERYVKDDDTFMLTYGDGVSDVDINAVLKFHRAHGRLATVTTMCPPSRFGVLDINASGEVNKFAEKPQGNYWANAGFFVFNKKVFDYVSSDPKCILEREPMERLAAAGQLMAYQHRGFFYAMDTYREYLQLNEWWNNGQTPWKVWQ